MNVHISTIFRHWPKTKTTQLTCFTLRMHSHSHTDTHIRYTQYYYSVIKGTVSFLESRLWHILWMPCTHTRTHSQRLLSNGNANLWQNQIGITKTSASRSSGTLGRVWQRFVWLSLPWVFYKSINQQLVPINHAYNNDNNNNELLYPISQSFNQIPFLT